MNIRRAGYWLLDVTQRSWTAFWGTLAAIGAYAAYNCLAHHAFDPYPFIFLTLIVTVLSYQQNIIVLTIQKDAAIAQERQDRYMLNMQEAVYAFILEKNPELAHPADHTEADGVV